MLSMEKSLQRIINVAEEAAEVMRELEDMEHVPREGPTVGFSDLPSQ